MTLFKANSINDKGTFFVEEFFPLRGFENNWPAGIVIDRVSSGSSSLVIKGLFGSVGLSELIARIEFMSGSITPLHRFWISLRKLIHAVKR